MLRNAQISQNHCAIAGGTSSLNSWSFLFCISKSRWNQIDNFLQTRLTIVGDHHFSKFKTCRYWDGPISACLGFTWNQDMQILAQSWFWKLRLIYNEILLCASFPLIRSKKYLSQNRCPTNICMSWFQVRPRHVNFFSTNLATKVSHLGLHIFLNLGHADIGTAQFLHVLVSPETRTCRYWWGICSVINIFFLLLQGKETYKKFS